MPIPPRGLELVLGTHFQSTLQDTIVMSNFGYFQLKANPGAWILRLKENSRSSEIFELSHEDGDKQFIIVSNFGGTFKYLEVKRRPGREQDQLLLEGDQIFEHNPDENSWTIGY